MATSYSCNVGKALGSPKVHCLRIIQLLEYSKNQTLCIAYAHQLSHLAEDNVPLDDSQYDSRLVKSCLTPVLNKWLTYDLFHQTKNDWGNLESWCKRSIWQNHSSTCTFSNMPPWNDCQSGTQAWTNLEFNSALCTDRTWYLITNLSLHSCTTSLWCRSR